MATGFVAAAAAASISPSHLSLHIWSSSRLPFSSQLLNNILPHDPAFKSFPPRRLGLVAAAKSDDGDTEDSSAPLPSWAQPGTDELPPWARQESQSASSSQAVPFYVYLLASTVTAIAAVGSIFEYVNQKPVFGVLNSDSVFYAPLLGFFVVTGFPSSEMRFLVSFVP
ncbi:uncharacterized protein LOC127241790 isoform X2 [Andrographis paniculata]|uniref:uncharacterized protein LOC127241790 isoform X2 n=1 Tax=Andrographis paniculata TaxID=175694 RepID=UPI0021E70C79|nr:uncharacterized protein LOC127241790 isoform X2 [Andrographis paniculata]